MAEMTSCGVNNTPLSARSRELSMADARHMSTLDSASPYLDALILIWPSCTAGLGYQL
jgi:hypothetical protein